MSKYMIRHDPQRCISCKACEVHCQFGVNDPLIANGKLGVFARSSSDMAVTVNYSDLMVWEVIP